MTTNYYSNSTESPVFWEQAVDYAYTESFDKADEVTDTISKIYFANWLMNNSKSCTKWHDTPDYSRVDGAVYNVMTDTIICFELKKRNLPSTKYGDAFLTVEKYNHIKTSQAKLRQTLDINGLQHTQIKNILITFFSDGTFAMWDVDDWVDSQMIYMSATTEKTYGSKRKKDVYMYRYDIKNSRMFINDINILNIYN